MDASFIDNLCIWLNLKGENKKIKSKNQKKFGFEKEEIDEEGTI